MNPAPPVMHTRLPDKLTIVLLSLISSRSNTQAKYADDRPIIVAARSGGHARALQLCHARAFSREYAGVAGVAVCDGEQRGRLEAPEDGVVWLETPTIGPIG